MILVVLERPGDLFLRHFWPITLPSEPMKPDDVLALYRGLMPGYSAEAFRAFIL